MRQTVSRWRRTAATILPAARPALMLPVFRYTVRRFVERRGYQAGLAVYWALCWGLSGCCNCPEPSAGPDVEGAQRSPA